jgi:hypothetical protein
MDRLTEGIVTILTAIVGVAILAVLVSSRSNTAGVLGAAGSAFSNALSAATGPVTGATARPVNSTGGMFSLGNLNLPGAMSFS